MEPYTAAAGDHVMLHDVCSFADAGHSIDQTRLAISQNISTGACSRRAPGRMMARGLGANGGPTRE
jgi:hypothetical protein